MATTPAVKPKKIFSQTKEAERRLREDIANGVWGPGAQVSALTCSRRYGISEKAMWGVLERAQGDGALRLGGSDRRRIYYVPPPAPERGSVARPSTRAERIADQLRAELGTKYPLKSQLPLRADLAMQYGTDPSTMSAATTILRDEGLVLPRGRLGTWVIALPPGRSPEQGQKVWTYLRDGILDGAWEPGEVLPSRDVLATKMNVGPATITGAYERLIGEGLVEAKGRMGMVVRPKAEWPVQRAELAEQSPAPPAPDGDVPGDLIPASDVMPLIKVLYDELREKWKAEQTAREVGERLANYDEEIKRLRGDVAEWRGKFYRKEEENAELRGKLHHQKEANSNGGRVIRSFGPEFKNTLNMSDADAEKIKGLLATKRLMETPRER